MESLDLRGLIIPFSLLKASNAFRSLKQGEELELLCNDPENIAHLLRIIPSDSCELISLKNLNKPLPGVKARLKKKNQ